MKKLFVFFATLFICTSLFAEKSKLVSSDNKKNREVVSSTQKVVKVGFIITTGDSFMVVGDDSNKQKDGYAYEYLRNLASYTGWKYEYVYGYFSDLCELLVEGKIDLLPDVTYTEERSKVMNFPNHDMGVETYYLYSKKNHGELKNNKDFSFLKGKTVGINKNSYQYNLFYEWKKNNNVECIVQEYDFSDEVGNLLNEGKIDYYLEIDYVAEDDWIPVAKIGSSNFYLAVNKNKNDLLDELNFALSELYSINPYYNHLLWNRYYLKNKIDYTLNDREVQWFKEHNNTLKVGVISDDLPFSYEEKGVCKGVIVDFLQYFKSAYSLDVLKINYIFFDDYFSLDDAIHNGTVDVAFPFIYDNYAAETFNTITSNPIAKVPICVITKKNNLDGLKTNVAVKRGGRAAYFASVHYPNLNHNYYNDVDDVLFSVVSDADDASDGAILNYYKAKDALYGRKRYEKLEMSRLPEFWEICFVFPSENFILCNLTNRIFSTIDGTEVSSVIEKYTEKNHKYTVKHLIDDYFVQVLVIITCFTLLVLALFFAFDKLLKYYSYDELTKLLSRKNIKKYYEKMNKSNLEKKHKLSFLLFDIDDFTHINDFYGQECGDLVIKQIASTILKIVNDSGVVFRSGGEEFFAILKIDYNNAVELAERCRKIIENQTIEYNFTKIKVTISVAITDNREDLTLDDLFFNVQKLLSIAKSKGKNRIQGKLEK